MVYPLLANPFLCCVVLWLVLVLFCVVCLLLVVLLGVCCVLLLGVGVGVDVGFGPSDSPLAPDPPADPPAPDPLALHPTPARPKCRSFFSSPVPIFTLFVSLWLHTTARELQTCTFEGPGLQKHHQNSTRRHPETNKKSENGSGRGKKREILGPPPFGAPPFGAALRGPSLRGFLFSGFGPHPLGPHHDTHQI